MVTSYLRKIWLWLTEPAASVASAQERDTARLFSALLLSQLALGVLAVVVLFVVLSPAFVTMQYVLLAFALMAVGYALTRTRHYQLGAVLYIGTAFVLVFAIVLADPTLLPDRALNFLVLVVLLTSLLLSVEATIIVSVASIVGILLLSMFPAYNQSSIFTALGFVTLTSTLIVTASMIRQRHQLDSRRKSLELAESEARYRSLLDASFEAIIVHDDGHLLDANRTFERMFGYSLPEVLGRPVLDFVPQESHGLILQSWRRGVEESLETEGQRRDGTVFPVEMVNRPHTYKGRPVQVAVLRDITERKMVEEQRLQLLVEKQRVTVLRRFVSDASHDLRTPLTNLKTSSYLVKKLAHDPEKQKLHVEVIERQTARLERLLSELLTMSRLDAAATGEFHFGATDLNNVIPELIHKHKVMAASKNHIVEFIPGENVGHVLIDPEKLPIAIASLLINAHTYTPSGGKITVRTYRQDDMAAIEVQDTGIGIDPADMERIFDSFYRADKARSADTGGAGLGLAIAKRIVEVHGGTIKVESEPDKGSRFVVFLPCEGPHDYQQADSPVEQPEG